MNYLTRFERILYDQGFENIVGIDEAGRGPLAGPVVAAAVILKPNAKFTYVNDSKKLTKRQRNLALEEINNNAIEISISIIDSKVIDQVNIYEATKIAMIESLNNLKSNISCVLIDAMPLNINVPNISIKKGDQKSVSIAAASIVAKTARDNYMKEMDLKYPKYNFKKHKGYPTKEHIELIKRYGITEIHRKTFEPIKSILNERN